MHTQKYRFDHLFSLHWFLNEIVVFTGWLGLCVQFDCWNWSLDNAESLSSGWLAAESYPCDSSSIYEVSVNFLASNSICIPEVQEFTF